MATVTYVGKQRFRAQSGTLTVTTADTGGTITLTVGGTNDVVITPTTTNTTTTAGELLDAIEAAAATNPAIAEITFTQSTNVITFVGPDDGAPLTLAKADGGTNATTLSATGVAAPLSPYDAADAENYSGGAVPSNGDTLVCDQAGAAIKYGLTGLAAVALANFVRAPGFQVGLPDVNPAGYPEFRTTHLSLNSALATVKTGAADPPQGVRLNLVTTACTLTVLGDGGGQVGAEVVTLKGSATATAVNCTGGSVAVCPLADETLTLTTLRAIGAAVRVGVGCTLGTPSFYGSTALLEASWSSALTLDGGQVEVGRAATGALTIDAGTVLWKGTAAPSNSPAVGGGGVLDFSQAPAAFTLGGTATLYAGASLLDPAGRAGNFVFQCVRCSLQEVTVVTANGKTFTLS